MATKFYKGKIPIVVNDLNEGFIRGEPDEAPSYGCIPRDYDVDPVEMRDSPDAMQVMTDAEVRAAFDRQEADQSSLEHIYLRGGVPAFTNLDQNGDGHCWCYSTGHALMFDRLKQGLPGSRESDPGYVKLNPHCIAAILRQLNGGWAGLSMKFVRQYGCAVEGKPTDNPTGWPKWDNNPGYFDNPGMKEEMLRHQNLEDWYDLGMKEWQQKLSRQQLKTVGSQNIPAPSDFSRAGHSMCQIRWVFTDYGEGPLILNSWKGWGYHGLAVLLNWDADNSVALRASTPSDK